MASVRPYRECKALGHRWDEIPSDGKVPIPEAWKRGGRIFIIRCDRCSTVRIDFRDRFSYEVKSREYIYPDGYQYAEKVTRAQIFRELDAERRAKRKARHLRRGVA